MHKIFYAKGTVALAPHIALEEAGVQYESQLLVFSNNDQQDQSYLQINPKARVPSLITPRGILSETPAILAYIAQSWPEANLAPSDPYEFGLAQTFNNYLASTLHVAHAHKLRGSRWSDDSSAHDSMRAKVAENMTACASLIEKEYLQGPWVLGDQYSICDPYLFTVCKWMPGDGVNMDDFPDLIAHQAAMLTRPTVAKINPLYA